MLLNAHWNLVSGKSSHLSSKMGLFPKPAISSNIFRVNHGISSVTKTSSTVQHQLLISKEQPSQPLRNPLKGRIAIYIGQAISIWMKRSTSPACTLECGHIFNISSVGASLVDCAKNTMQALCQIWPVRLSNISTSAAVSFWRAITASST